MSTTGIPRHTTRQSIIAAKLDFLTDTARQYANGCCTVEALVLAAMDYSDACEAPLAKSTRAKAENKETA